MSVDWPHDAAGAGCMAAKGEEASMVAVGGWNRLDLEAGRNAKTVRYRQLQRA